MKWPKNGIVYQSNDFLHDASVFITICLNDLFPSMCDTRLTSFTISLLINVAFCTIEGLNVLSYFKFYTIFFSMCVCQFFHGRTYCGTKMVYWLWWLGQLDLFHRSQYTYYLWFGLSRNDNNISLALLCKVELVMCMDKHCGTENKYQNIKDHNNKFPIFDGMLLLFTAFSINHLVFQLR